MKRTGGERKESIREIIKIDNTQKTLNEEAGLALESVSNQSSEPVERKDAFSS